MVSFESEFYMRAYWGIDSHVLASVQHYFRWPKKLLWRGVLSWFVLSRNDGPRFSWLSKFTGSGMLRWKSESGSGLTIAYLIQNCWQHHFSETKYLQGYMQNFQRVFVLCLGRWRHQKVVGKNAGGGFRGRRDDNSWMQCHKFPGKWSRSEIFMVCQCAPEK